MAALRWIRQCELNFETEKTWLRNLGEKINGKKHFFRRSKTVQICVVSTCFALQKEEYKGDERYVQIDLKYQIRAPKTDLKIAQICLVHFDCRHFGGIDSVSEN